MWVLSTQGNPDKFGEHRLWVVLDEKPVVFHVPDNTDMASYVPPVVCTDDTDIHIHVKDLVEMSHWNDDADPTHQTVGQIIQRACGSYE
jgi:hypothetical protein